MGPSEGKDEGGLAAAGPRGTAWRWGGSDMAYVCTPLMNEVAVYAWGIEYCWHRLQANTCQMGAARAPATHLAQRVDDLLLRGAPARLKLLLHLPARSGRGGAGSAGS